MGAFVGWDGRRVLSVGGRTAAGREAGAAAFDPVAGTWSKLADPPSSVVAAIAMDPVGWSTGPVSFDVGGRVLFLGGEGDEEAIAWWFDPAADTWAEAPSPPAPVTAATPTVWTGRVLLAWLAATDPGGAVAVFDPATARWSTAAAPAPIRYREGGVSVWTGSRWLVWGGQAADGTTYGDGASYDPASGRWETIAPGPLSPRRAKGTWTGMDLVILGGSVGERSSVMALVDAAAYNPTSGWHVLPSGPGHPGHLPVWTGRYVALFAKGGVALFDASDAVWRDACCNEVGGAIGRPVWTGGRAILLGSGTPDIGGVAFTPPTVDPPPGSSDSWNREYAPSVGFDDVTAWRLNAIVELRNGRFRDGVNDVVFTGQRRITLTGDPAVIETLRADIEALGLTIDAVVEAASPTSTPTTAPPPARPADALLQHHGVPAPLTAAHPWPAGTTITLEQCSPQGDGSWTFRGSLAGVPAGTDLTLHLELGYDGIGTSGMVTATVQHDGAYELSFDALYSVATDCTISDPANAAATNDRIAVVNPAPTLSR
ncbi:MAG: hypothetical protein AB7Q92_21685 [Acidimicrobiia bacterium]